MVTYNEFLNNEENYIGVYKIVNSKVIQEKPQKGKFKKAENVSINQIQGISFHP